MNSVIPYHKIYNTGREIEYVNDCIRRGQPSGDGHYTRLVGDLLKGRFKLGEVYMTTSATHALEMAMLVIDLKPGDEVIMPSFTFSSTANAVLLRGAKPVFAEIDENTLNIDPDALEKHISRNTKAIIPVHYAGVSCGMDKIMEVAGRKGLYVIEDAAQAVNSRYNGRYLGSIGHMGCYSFHGTKNYTCGEGGALAINSDCPGLLERADYIREKGTDRGKFLRGEADSYSWVGIGSSYSPSDILMAVLYAQLEHMDLIREKRRLIHEYYIDILNSCPEKPLFKLMEIPPGCEANYHIFYLLFKNKEIRDTVRRKLYEKGITALTHFVPLHSSSMGRKLGYRQGDFKKTELAAECLLRLPIYTDMSNGDMNYVGEQLKEILEGL